MNDRKGASLRLISLINAKDIVRAERERRRWRGQRRRGLPTATLPRLPYLTDSSLPSFFDKLEGAKDSSEGSLRHY